MAKRSRPCPVQEPVDALLARIEGDHHVAERRVRCLLAAEKRRVGEMTLYDLAYEALDSAFNLRCESILHELGGCRFPTPIEMFRVPVTVKRVK